MPVSSASRSRDQPTSAPAALSYAGVNTWRAHSEGTLTAPVLAARKGEVAGLVLLCPTVAPMEATLLAQAAQLSKDIGQMPRLSGAVMRAYFALAGGPLRTQQRLIERVRASTQDMLRRGLSRIPAKWLRELLLASPGVV